MVLSDNEQSCKMYKASGAFCAFLVLEGVALLRVSHIQHPKTCSKPCRQTSELSQEHFCPSQDMGPTPGKHIQGVV